MLITTEFSDAEHAQIQSLMQTTQARDQGDVLRAALATYHQMHTPTVIEPAAPLPAYYVDPFVAATSEPAAPSHPFVDPLDPAAPSQPAVQAPSPATEEPAPHAPTPVPAAEPNPAAPAPAVIAQGPHGH